MVQFKFDKVLYQVVDSQINLRLGFLVLIVGFIDLFFRFNFFLAAPVIAIASVYWVHKGRYPKAYLKEKEAEVVEVTESTIRVHNKLTGYDVSKNLTEIQNVQFKPFFGFGLVIVDFAGNERFKFLCYKNAQQLIGLLSGKGL